MKLGCLYWAFKFEAEHWINIILRLLHSNWFPFLFVFTGGRLQHALLAESSLWARSIRGDSANGTCCIWVITSEWINQILVLRRSMQFVSIIRLHTVWRGGGNITSSLWSTLHSQWRSIDIIGQHNCNANVFSSLNRPTLSLPRLLFPLRGRGMWSSSSLYPLMYCRDRRTTVSQQYLYFVSH